MENVAHKSEVASEYVKYVKLDSKIGKIWFVARLLRPLHSCSRKTVIFKMAVETDSRKSDKGYF